MRIHYSLSLAATLLLTTLLSAPFLSFAQTEAHDNLRTAIQAAVIADPRSATIPPSQMNAMIDALTSQAESQGMTSETISENQNTAPQQTVVTNACTAPAFLCVFNDAFGFSGNDHLMAIWLGVSAALIAIIIAILLEVHHLHRKAAHILSDQHTR